VGDSLFQSFQSNGKGLFAWLAQEQMDMLGHNDIASHLKLLTRPNLVQCGEKEASRHRRVKQWSPLVTTESDEVKVPETIVAL
jgi:hypothetical protein